LDQIADQLDRRSEQEGDDSSFLRLALGREFLRREQPQQAESHLRTALELSPANRAAAVALVESLDGQNRPEDAIDAVLNLCRLSEPATDCFVDLHDRYLQINDAAHAERAATSIVEVAVEESSNHAALAELREGQEDWSAAIQHWRRAASLKAEEPHALVRLTQAQLQAGRKQDAVATFRKLRTTKWDDRFEELPEQIRKLRRRINTAR
jgi:tetratricopeptide (TPR) repeat protein